MTNSQTQTLMICGQIKKSFPGMHQPRTYHFHTTERFLLCNPIGIARECQGRPYIGNVRLRGYIIVDTPKNTTLHLFCLCLVHSRCDGSRPAPASSSPRLRPDSRSRSPRDDTFGLLRRHHRLLCTERLWRPRGKATDRHHPRNCLVV